MKRFLVALAAIILCLTTLSAKNAAVKELRRYCASLENAQKFEVRRGLFLLAGQPGIKHVSMVECDDLDSSQLSHIDDLLDNLDDDSTLMSLSTDGGSDRDRIYLLPEGKNVLLTMLSRDGSEVSLVVMKMSQKFFREACTDADGSVNSSELKKFVNLK